MPKNKRYTKDQCVCCAECTKFWCCPADCTDPNNAKECDEYNFREDDVCEGDSIFCRKHNEDDIEEDFDN